MNARDNTPLRAQIADRLAAGEDTAAGIAQAIGKGDTPSIVVKELNAMRTDGQVECERRERGKKKGLVYWLAVPLEVAASNVAPESADDRHPAAISESVLPAGMRQGTRAAQIYRALPAFGAEPIDARAIATTTGCAKALIDGALWAMVKAGQCVRHTNGGPYGYTRLPPAGSDSEGGETDVQPQTAEIPPQITPEIPPPQYDPRSVSFSAEKDDELLAVANALAGMSTDRRADLSVLSRASETLEALLPPTDDIEGLDVDALAERVAERVRELEADLRNQLETLQREAMRGATCLSGQDRYTAAGYLVRASKRKPRTLLDKDKARDAALSSIRAGAQRAEVFALVPIGHARRGAAWWPA